MIAFQDPIQVIIDIFEQRHPKKKVIVQYVQGMKEKADAYGETFFPNDGGIPIVSIDVEISIIGAIDVLAHELAHVAIGPDGKHGEKWDNEYTEINNSFHKKFHGNY